MDPTLIFAPQWSHCNGMAKKMIKTIQAWDNCNVNSSKEHKDLGLSIA
jgi:hypothetical protein